MAGAVIRCLGALWTIGMYLGLRVGVWLVRRYPNGPSNCLIWALQQQQRHGGDLRLTPSRFGPWMHFIWLRPDGWSAELNPVREKARFLLPKWRLPPPLFRGSPRAWKP